MNIYITFDYELFLGEETGSVNNCLIQPMAELSKIAEQYGVSFTIFVDGAYLLRLFELKSHCDELRKDWISVESNIKELSEKGHDIEFHFHPQWLFSHYDSVAKKWRIDIAHYKMSDVEDESFLRESFSKARSLLEKITGKRVVAFRAGGYCLEGIDYARLFMENNIIVDSSVARNMYFHSRTHTYDYRKIPKETIYPFLNNVHCKEEHEIRFFELSLSSMRWNLYAYLTKFRKIFRTYHPVTIYRDGTPIKDIGRTLLIRRILEKFRGTTTLCSVDGPLSLFLEDYYQGAERTSNNDLVLIGHPKNASDVSIRKLDDFIFNHRSDVFCTVDTMLKHTISVPR